MKIESEWLVFVLSGIGVFVLFLILFGIQTVFSLKLKIICRRLNLLQDHTELAAARRSSIWRHYKATGLNAAGLAGGIILVFSSATFGEKFSFWALQAGVWMVVISIGLYLFTEWTACDDDEQIADLTSRQEQERHKQLVSVLSTGGAVPPEGQRLNHATVTFTYEDDLKAAPSVDFESRR